MESPGRSYYKESRDKLHDKKNTINTKNKAKWWLKKKDCTSRSLFWAPK